MSKRRAKLLCSDDSVCAFRRRRIARASVKKGIRLPCLSLLKDMDFRFFFCHRRDAERAEAQRAESLSDGSRQAPAERIDRAIYSAAYRSDFGLAPIGAAPTACENASLSQWSGPDSAYGHFRPTPSATRWRRSLMRA